MVLAASRLHDLWRRLARIPGGRLLFSRLLGWMVPYTGSIRPLVLEAEPGRAVVALRERRRVRNHFGSVHAIALANLGELASGLAMTFALPDGVQGIPIRIRVEYHRKARGRIVARGRADPPASVVDEVDAEARATLGDGRDDPVAEVFVTWRLAPRDGPATPPPAPDSTP